ncbi:MAG: twin-arginine translocase subunit TatC [bacterium]
MEELADIITHLNELRTRILWSLLFLVIGIIIGWFIFPFLYEYISAPVLKAVAAKHGEIISTTTTGPLFTMMNVALIAGVAISLPFILWQLWLFIRPGLHPHEQRAMGPFVPAIGVLFLFGILLAYYMLPVTVSFLLSFYPSDVKPLIDYQHALEMPIKFMLSFGLAFQLPIIMFGLVKLRIISAEWLLKQWRFAIVIISIIAAIVTPTPDPFNMSLVMIPLIILYFITALFARRIGGVEK